MAKAKNERTSIFQKGLGAIAFVIVLALFWLFFSVLGDIFWTDTNSSVKVEIPSGAGVRQIARILKENEVIKYPAAFYVYSQLGGDRVYHNGMFELKKGMCYFDIVQILSGRRADLVRVTIPEGYELRQIAQLLEDKGVVSRNEFYAEVQKGDFSEYPYISDIKREENRLEGYLFPDTYEFVRGEDPHNVIKTMLAEFDSVVYSAYKESNTDKTLDEIIIMASIVEREAANDSERGKVASVFQNRINAGMKLQSCATVQYVLAERKDILSNEDIKIDSPYNTYKYEGLPAGPIASPGLNSVMAAINPEDTDYYYFAATADGSRNVFSKTGAEHAEKVKELQQK